MTQKEFVAAVRGAGVNDPHCPSMDFCHPGLFQVGDKQIKIEMRRLALFLVKLSAAIKFDYYDRLTRTVYIQHMQAERKAAYCIAEDRPQDATRLFWHSYSEGISWLSFLPLSEIKCNRFIDPIICFIVGFIIAATFSDALGGWLMFSAFSLYTVEMFLYESRIEKLLDQIDGMCDAVS